MSEAKHTPGPWVIDVMTGEQTDSGDTETFISAYADEDGQEGATIATVNRWAFGADPATTESDANAQLIAAAPELLAALVEAAGRLEAYIDPNVWDGHSAGVFRQMRAAIAKAVGVTR